MTRYRFDIPMPPSVNNLFTNRRGGGRVKSDRYKRWQDEAGWCIRTGMTFRTLTDSVRCRIEVTRPDNRRRDIDNLAKPVLDLLTRMQVIEDDQLVEELTLRWRPQNGPSNAEGATVTVSALEARCRC